MNLVCVHTLSCTGSIFASNIDDPYRIGTASHSSVAPGLAKLVTFNSSDTKKDTVPLINCASTVDIGKVSVTIAES